METTNHKEIEVKQLLGLTEEELERKNEQLVERSARLERKSKELVERSARLESDKEKLALLEIAFLDSRRELEILAVEIEEDRERAAKQLRELKLKDLQFKQREEEIDLLRKDLERQSRELESNRKKSDERMRKLDQRERQLDERVKVFESSKRRLDEDWKKLDFRIREVSCREGVLDRGLEQLNLKEYSLDMKSKEIELKRNKSDNLCKEIVMDGKTLQIYLNECWQNHEKMGDEVSFLLRLSQDPAELVLDALEGFFPPHLRNGNGEEFPGHIVQRSCILLLEQLRKISHDVKITPELKKEARRLSCVWITKLKPESEHPTEILGFLLVLAIYNVVSILSADEIFNYVKIVSHFEQVPELCCLLGMTEDKISGLSQDLVERKQHLVAIRYAYNFNLIEKFPLGSLLKDHVETSRIESAAIIKSGNKSRIAQSQARTRMISNLTAAITCIEKYNISSEYSPDNLRQMISSLCKHDKEEQKEADFSVPVSAIEPKAVVSTEDPLPKRRKLLDGKSTSTENADSKLEEEEEEEEVCGSGKDLRALKKHETEQTELAVSSYTDVKKLAVDLPLNAATSCIMAEEGPQLQQTGTDFPDIAISQISAAVSMPSELVHGHYIPAGLCGNRISVEAFRSSCFAFDPEGILTCRNPVPSPRNKGDPVLRGVPTLPSEGEGVMYCGLVKAGMRVPYCPALVELCTFFGIAPVQITPVSFKLWVGFKVLCQREHWVYSLNAFRCLHSFQREKNGVVSFRPRHFSFLGARCLERSAMISWQGRSLVSGRGTTHTNYKVSYFFYRGCPVTWPLDSLDRGAATIDDLSDDDLVLLRAICEKYKDGVSPPIAFSSITERDLLEAGLRSAPLMPCEFPPTVTSNSAGVPCRDRPPVVLGLSAPGFILRCSGQDSSAPRASIEPSKATVVEEDPSLEHINAMGVCQDPVRITSSQKVGASDTEPSNTVSSEEWWWW